MRRHAGDATGKNLATLGDEFFQEIGIFVIDCFDGDVDPAPRHGPIRPAKSGTSFGSLRLHRVIISFRDEGCGVAKTGCIFSSPAGSECADFSCYGWSCSARAACRALLPQWTPGWLF